MATHLRNMDRRRPPAHDLPTEDRKRRDGLPSLAPPRPIHATRYRQRQRQWQLPYSRTHAIRAVRHALDHLA